MGTTKIVVTTHEDGVTHCYNEDDGILPTDNQQAATHEEGNFSNLYKGLEGWFDTCFADLPEDVRRNLCRDRVLRGIWDELTPKQRREAARQWDYQHDPANNDEQERWFNHYQELRDQLDEKNKQLKEWELTTTQEPKSLQVKEKRIAKLKLEIKRLEQLIDQDGVQGATVEGHEGVADGFFYGQDEIELYLECSWNTCKKYMREEGIKDPPEGEKWRLPRDIGKEIKRKHPPKKKK